LAIYRAEFLNLQRVSM